MKNQKGFTIIELLIVFVMVVFFAGIIASGFVNNRGATEARAYTGADKFITDNAIQIKRLTCAGDSDGDGYGSCTLATMDGERIRISCPTNWADINIFDASSCKEVFMDYQFGGTGMAPPIRQ